MNASFGHLSKIDFDFPGKPMFYVLLYHFLSEICKWEVFSDFCSGTAMLGTPFLVFFLGREHIHPLKSE